MKLAYKTVLRAVACDNTAPGAITQTASITISFCNYTLKKQTVLKVKEHNGINQKFVLFSKCHTLLKKNTLKQYFLHLSKHKTGLQMRCRMFVVSASFIPNRFTDRSSYSFPKLLHQFLVNLDDVLKHCLVIFYLPQFVFHHSSNCLTGCPHICIISAFLCDRCSTTVSVCLSVFQQQHS